MVDRSSVARAQSRIADLKGFYTHLFIYAAVVAGLFLINAASSGPWWAQWVLFGWGIGIAGHGVGAFMKKRGQET